MIETENLIGECRDCGHPTSRQICLACQHEASRERKLTVGIVLVLIALGGFAWLAGLGK